MARIEFDRIAHAYMANPKTEADYALKELSMTWDDGGAYALLGPSGCGKTTLLNIISGLLEPSGGAIRFDGNDVTHLSTQARNIAQVFQFPVIYDTMTVRQNLEFPLRNRGVDPAEIDRRVSDTLRIIDLEEKADRRARRLTADEKQKISLGRGLVRSDVNAILFDEPLTVIDPHMKWVLRSKLKELHQRFAFTMIYVTHDQTEALTFADKVVVMYEGQVVQTGTPAELFHKPRHTFVGYFIGSPGMNVLPCEVTGKTAMVGSHKVRLPAAAPRDAGKLEVGIRPEFITLKGKGAGIPVQVRRVEDIGRFRIVHADMEGTAIAATLPEGAEVPADPRAVLDPANINLYADSWLVEGKA